MLAGMVAFAPIWGVCHVQRKGGFLMRAKYRKFFTAPAQGRRGRSAGVWFIAATALISCAVSWWPQPVTATVHQGPVTRLALGPAVQRHLLRLYAAYRHIPARS